MANRQMIIDHLKLAERHVSEAEILVEEQRRRLQSIFIKAALSKYRRHCWSSSRNVLRCTFRIVIGF